MQWLPQQRRRLLVVLVGAVIGVVGLTVALSGPDESAMAQRIQTGSAAEGQAAVAELESCRTAAAARFLAEAAASDKPQVAAAAVLALSRLDAEEALRQQTVMTALRRPEPEVRKAAVVSYGRVFPIGRAQQPEMIIDLLRSDAVTEIRAAAAKALGHLHVFDALPALLEATENESPALRAQAAASMMRILCVKMDFNPHAPLAQRRAVTDRLAQIARRPSVKLRHADWIKHRYDDPHQ